MRLRGFYAIADAAHGDVVTLGRALLAADPCALQVRAKGLPAEAVAAALRALHPHCRAAGVPLLVNDLAELWPLADGAHLGWEDGEFPPDFQGLRGRSTHDLTQVAAATAEGVHYLGFGPVFGTSTKAEAGEARGLEQLAAAVRATALPVVAIGGVTAARLAQVKATGVACWAAISATCAADDVRAAARALR